MLALDEEVDYLEYQRYLRSQTDSDLLDIVTHLNSQSCPRRAEAARRELGRRRISMEAHYADSENLWRKFLMIVIAFIALTQLLGMTMSREEAIAPQPLPSLDLQTGGEFLQFSGSPLVGGDQMTASIIGVYCGQLTENDLRAVVLFASRSGLYLLIFCVTLWKLLANLREGSLDDPLNVEVRRMLVIAVTAQVLLFSFSACNNLPLLVNGGHSVDAGFLARAITVLAPWG